MAVLLGKTQERLAKPHWRRNGIPFRFACLGGVICTSLSASSIFRPAEPKFLDQVVTLSGESGLLWDEDRKSWIGSLPKPLETAELTLEPLVEFLIAPSPGEELILNSSGDRIFGPHSASRVQMAARSAAFHFPRLLSPILLRPRNKARQWAVSR